MMENKSLVRFEVLLTGEEKQMIDKLRMRFCADRGKDCSTARFAGMVLAEFGESFGKLESGKFSFVSMRMIEKRG